MIINCNNLCRKSGGVTEGSLDLDDNKVYCTKCNDELTSVSIFMKEAMKRNKDIIKKTIAKAFTFKCISCNKMVETNIVNGTPVGKYCETKNCSISISQIMVNAMEKMKPIPMDDENE
jgi:hypothetical protein